MASNLKGEFTRSTGESDKKRAQELLPLIAAEYEAKVKQARDRLGDNKFRDLSEAEMRRLAAHFYRDALPHYRVGRALGPVEHEQLIRETREKVDHLQRSLAARNFATVSAAARGIIERSGLPVPEESPSVEALQDLLMRASIELHRSVLAQLEGNTNFVPADPVVAGLATTHAKPARTVGDLIDAYTKAKLATWSKSTAAAAGTALRIVRDVLGGREAAEVTREDARSIRELVVALPANLGKLRILKGLAIPQAVAEAQRLGLPTITAKTAGDGYMVHIAALFAFALREGWVTRNEFAGLAIADPIDARDKRDPFKTDQLQQLFSAGPWCEPFGADTDRPGRYWIPLIALFSGMRLGEIAGLRVMDFERIEGVDVLQLRSHTARSLKTAESRREVPIHPQLLRLGLLQYIEQRRMRAALADPLFPDAKPNARGQAGAKLGEWFVSHLRERGISGMKLGMHSFRHNFEDRLREAGVAGTEEALYLTGRKSPGSRGTYGVGPSTSRRAATMAKVEYPGLGLAHLEPAPCAPSGP